MTFENKSTGRQISGQDSNPQWLIRFRSLRPTTMVALGRLFLGGFAGVTVTVDPDASPGDPAFVFGLVIAYLLFAGAMLILAQTRLRFVRQGLASHTLDIAFFAMLIHLTDGVTSPFFVYFTFVLLSGTLRWGWRGGAVTTVAALATYVVLTLIGNAQISEHLDRFVVRSSYLILAGLLTIYFAARIERARLRLALLADWPAAPASEFEGAPIGPLLAHAAWILRLSHLVVVWRDDTKNGLQIAVFSEGTTKFSSITHDLPKSVDPLPASVDQKIHDEYFRGLLDGFGWPPEEQKAIVSPLQGCGPQGRLLAYPRGGAGRDLLPLIAIVATRVSGELERHILRKELVAAAGAAERARLGRDIHDDVLQALTAVTLQLKLIEDRSDGELAQHVAAARNLISQQQQHLREIIMFSPDGSTEISSLTVRLREIAEILRTQWSCEIELDLRVEELFLREHVTRSIIFFINEAVANGARHGGASRFLVEILLADRDLRVMVRDDGTGLPQKAGCFDHEEILLREIGSMSLRRRAEDLGWRMRLETSGQGTSVEVQIPWPVEAHVACPLKSGPP